jgi:hypothetical protein
LILLIPSWHLLSRIINGTMIKSQFDVIVHEKI